MKKEKRYVTLYSYSLHIRSFDAQDGECILALNLHPLGSVTKHHAFAVSILREHGAGWDHHHTRKDLFNEIFTRLTHMGCFHET